MSDRGQAGHSGPEPVAVRVLKLSDFRSYPSLSLRLDAPLVAFVGPNGAGKTNLLEAVSLLTPGRGLRRAAYGEILRLGGAERWAVSAVLEHGAAETRLGTGWERPAPGGSDQGRIVRVDGADVPSAEALLDHLRILWITPAMDGLFTGPAGDRRRFLDRLVLAVDPEHGRRSREFERLLTSRNRLLEEGAASSWCDAVEAELAGRGVAIALARAETVALLSARIAERSAGSAFPAAGLSLTGEFEPLLAGRSAAEVELAYRRALRDGRERDRAARRTLLGPHRSDLDVVFAEKAVPAALSSTGEQKALLIGLVLAQADLVAATSGMTPILLLDEIAAHLDPNRRAALFARLSALGVQALMTGTDPLLFEHLPEPGLRFRVEDGGAAPIRGA
ncbi:DNA replication/repair protein RecF [Propylenella binzhouense]|uniref:DNA replication and repair protein RecF n=1 Tax=Propylenella binzhouense TaxID=2555902 RepID=A0A964T8K5_9HYPH|nr:DNA replication/repair protein RecF [Propylenella binzhouense]